MDSTALGLVLVAAFVHAGWNLAAKRVAGGGARFVFLYYTVSAMVCLPLALITLLVVDDRPQWSWLLAVSVTAVLHVGYGVVLQRGYDVGDLSIVYPLARGTGPLLSVLAAVVLFGERPGVLGGVGALLVVTGVLVLGWGSDSTDPAARWAGIGYGLLTGVAIAAYTLWDAHAMNSTRVPPVVYFGLAALLQSVLLAPGAVRDLPAVAGLWRRHRREVVLVGVLSPVAYLLVLFALQTAPVSLVAPARELSIVLGGLGAWLMLGEAAPVRRLIGSAIVLAGIGAIAGA